VSVGPWLAAFERMLGSARRRNLEGHAAPPSSPRALPAYGDTWHPGMPCPRALDALSLSGRVPRRAKVR
jgi:hypothetical protein